MTGSIVSSEGTIVRVVDENLAYAHIQDSHRTLSFMGAAIPGFRGETLNDLNIIVGANVALKWDTSSLVVSEVTLKNDSLPSGLESARDHLTYFEITQALRRDLTTEGVATEAYAGSGAHTSQLELDPSEEAAGCIAVFQALKPPTRQFGKIIDTSTLVPGDLLLSRELNPDDISRLISQVQSQGGYLDIDSKWTHAAMYLGDGANVVEATFDSIISGGNVRITNLFDYCTGAYSVRFRRSHYILAEKDGWRLCVRALSRLTRPYSFVDAARMWFDVVIRGQNFGSDIRRHSVSQAVVCSTLYADSYNEATKRSLGELGGVCVPAWLSISDEFIDVKPTWLSIR